MLLRARFEYNVIVVDRRWRRRLKSRISLRQEILKVYFRCLVDQTNVSDRDDRWRSQRSSVLKLAFFVKKNRKIQTKIVVLRCYRKCKQTYRPVASSLESTLPKGENISKNQIKIKYDEIECKIEPAGTQMLPC